MKSFKTPQIKIITRFLEDMSKGLMLGAIIGQWSIPELGVYYRILISINWFVFSLLSLSLAIYLAKYEY